MEIRQLEAFLMVAEELHFGRAADRLHMAQPALSRIIRSLERELGAPLFERTTRKVRLTPSGEALLGPAQEIQVQVDGIRRLTKAAQTGNIGKVKFGFAGAAGYAVGSALARLVSQQHPGVTLQLDPRNFSGEAETALHSGELDLAVITLPASAGISAHKVSDEALIAAIPDSHPLSGQESVRITDLGDEPIVSFPVAHGSQVRDVLTAAFAREGISPHIIQEAPDTYSLLTLIGAGVGISIVAASAEKIRVQGVKYRPITHPLPTMPIALGWRESNPSVALAAVIELARGAFPRA